MVKRFRGQRRHTRDVLIASNDDPTCNNEQLRSVINHNIRKTAEASKLAIHKIAEKVFKGRFAVTCSEESFTFIAESEMYCTAGNDKIQCHVFKL